MRRADAIVVGGGPAGSTCAWKLRQAGLEVLVLSLREEYLLAGALTIPLVLLARAISVGLPMGLMRRFRSFSPGVVSILTWGGLRGGISVALALSLPAGETRDLIVTVTYIVVVFSILVQGLTLAPVVRMLGPAARTAEAAETRSPADAAAVAPAQGSSPSPAPEDIGGTAAGPTLEISNQLRGLGYQAVMPHCTCVGRSRDEVPPTAC